MTTLSGSLKRLRELISTCVEPPLVLEYLDRILQRLEHSSEYRGGQRSQEGLVGQLRKARKMVGELRG